MVCAPFSIIWTLEPIYRAASGCGGAGLGRCHNSRNFDDTYKRFTRNLLNFALKTVLIISILNFAGFRTTSVIALLGAAGLAVGLALQGTLTNFAGGVLLLIFKPFKIGDLVEAQGKKGIVTEIQIFTTLIVTEDNKTVFIPNSMLSNGIIENYTYKKHPEEFDNTDNTD